MLGPYTIQSLQGSLLVKLSAKRELQSVLDLKRFAPLTQPYHIIPVQDLRVSLEQGSILEQTYQQTL